MGAKKINTYEATTPNQDRLDLGWRPKRDITVFPLRNPTNCHEPDREDYSREIALGKGSVTLTKTSHHQLKMPAITSPNKRDHPSLTTKVSSKAPIIKAGTEKVKNKTASGALKNRATKAKNETKPAIKVTIIVSSPKKFLTLFFIIN